MGLDVLDALEKFGNAVESLSTVSEEIAKEASEEILKISKSTAAAGTDPYGTKWRPTKDGNRAIPDAANAVDVIVRRTLIIIRVFRGAAIQNYISEEYRRQVIPDPRKPLPENMKAAIERSAAKVFARKMGK